MSGPVLCFGDSLTAGYYGVWPHPVTSPHRSLEEADPDSVKYHPYATRLGELLREVDAPEAHGYPGFCAHELLPKLQDHLKEKPWRCCVILAGSNDIIMAGSSVEQARDRVQALHAACKEVSVPVVVVANLDCDAENHGCVPPGEGPVRRSRLKQLGDALLAAAAADGLACCDPRPALPFPQPGDPSTAFWDDGHPPDTNGFRCSWALRR